MSIETGKVVVAKMETTTKENLAVGNNAKLREALMFLLENADFLLGAELPYWHKQVIHKAVERAKEAISAPARNCDIGTEREQSKRFDAYCYAHRTYEYGCSDCPLLQSVCCELAWGQMPYTKGSENE